jgi:hypothetical protein
MTASAKLVTILMRQQTYVRKPVEMESYSMLNVMTATPFPGTDAAHLAYLKVALFMITRLLHPA